ncbi:hypothetical protein PM082_014566 [Marasmius tenuissimus]|nr:hypothetical protein PM082_014566 [Marasmius tenuissimus]
MAIIIRLLLASRRLLFVNLVSYTCVLHLVDGELGTQSQRSSPRSFTFSFQVLRRISSMFCHTSRSQQPIVHGIELLPSVSASHNVRVRCCCPLKMGGTQANGGGGPGEPRKVSQSGLTDHNHTRHRARKTHLSPGPISTTTVFSKTTEQVFGLWNTHGGLSSPTDLLSGLVALLSRAGRLKLIYPEGDEDTEWPHSVAGAGDVSAHLAVEEEIEATACRPSRERAHAAVSSCL